MITLFTFGPTFGLPDASPFVTKAEVLLKLSGVPFESRDGGAKRLGKSPKGKLPYINDGGTLIGDSTFIRLHLETKYGIDFDKGFSPAERGTAWAFEKLCEDNLYWALVHSRWVDDANFDKGPRRFFDQAPAPIRPIIRAVVRRQVRKNLHAQGTGRHTKPQIEEVAIRGIDSIAAFLGDKPYLLGDAPCGADASVFAFVTGLLCTHFTTPIREAGARHENLVAYRDRGLKQWYPDMKA
ncbi:MAG: glutathione S-transferase family protein [Byssovorax sp.]